MTDVVILGSGMAAWGAHHRLTAEGLVPRLYDSRSHPGGHTASYRHPNGFVFDDGPHISFTEVPEVKELLADEIGGDHVEFGAYVDNYYRGNWVEHPVIVNMHGLPTDLVVDCVADFVEVHGREPEHIDNYLDWLVATYGRTYAETFPADYGLKYHTCAAEHMNTDWLGPRLYQADLKEVLRGAVRPGSADAHYVKQFRYPRLGGFQTFLDAFLARARPALEHEAVDIDPVERVVTFANGVTTGYDELVSSIPLPVVAPMVRGVPDRVVEAAGRLACTQCVIVNLGVARDDLSPAHWRYIYDLDIDSVRLSFPHMFSPEVVPPGHGAIQVEVYFSDKYKPLTQHPDELIDVVIADLVRMDLLRSEREVVFREARLIPWANVIFDLDTNEALAEVHAFLDEAGIRYCGRYGDWAYIWTDQSFLSGQGAAQRLLDEQG